MSAALCLYLLQVFKYPEEFTFIIEVYLQQGVRYPEVVQHVHLCLKRVVIQPYEVAVEVNAFCLEVFPIRRLDLLNLSDHLRREIFGQVVHCRGRIALAMGREPIAIELTGYVLD